MYSENVISQVDLYIGLWIFLRERERPQWGNQTGLDLPYSRDPPIGRGNICRHRCCMAPKDPWRSTGALRRHIRSPCRSHTGYSGAVQRKAGMPHCRPWWLWAESRLRFHEYSPLFSFLFFFFLAIVPP